MLSRGPSQVQQLQTLRVHTDDVSCCDFGANYLLASGSGDKTVRVWEWKKGSGYVEKSYSPLAAHRYAVTSVRFSSLGTMLASSSTDGSTILWNVWSGVRIHTFVQRNGCPVRLSIFSPDSTLLISAGDDGAVCIWDLLRRSLIRSFQAHRTTIQAMAITPDSKFLLTTDTVGMLKLWKDLDVPPPESAPASPNVASAPPLADTTTIVSSSEPADDSESLIMLLEDSHDMGVTGADFALTNETSAEYGTVKRYTLATCGNNSVIRMWNITVTLLAGAGKPLKLEPVPSPTSASTSPRRFGFGKNTLSAPAPVSPVDGESPPPLSPPASPNSLLGPQYSFRRRESSIKRRRRQCRITERLILGGHGSAVTCVRFSASGARLASSGLDKTVRLWEMPSGNCLHVLEGHSRFVACCAFSRDGALLASGSNDKQLIVWSVKGEVTLDSDLAVPMSVFREKLKSCKGDSVLPDPIEEGGPYAADADSCDGNVRDVQLLQRLDAHSSSVNSCHFHGNDQLVTAGGDKLIRLWHRSPAETRFVERPHISPISAHSFSINQVEYSPCGHFIASCSADGSAVLWNARTGQRASGSFATAGSSAIRACRFSPDGRLLVTAGDDERVSVWRSDTAELIMSFEGHKEAVVTVAISPDNQFLATACSGGHIRGWSLLPCWDRCIMLTEDAHDLGVQSCDFSPQIDPQGYLLATCGNDSTVRLWRIPTELGVISTPTSSTVGHSGLVTPPPASPLRSPKLPPSATLVRTLQGHGGTVICVRFSPCSGEFLASTASDSTARLWSVHQGDCLFVLESHSPMVTCCAFSANATILATGSLDKSVVLWKLPDHIAYQNTVATRLRSQHRRVLDWTPVDVCNWLKRSVEIPVNNALVYANDIDGCQLLTLPEGKLEKILNIDDQNCAELRRQIRWLRLEEMEVLLPEISSGANVPHDFLCPITREVMRDPVTCADGFTYERAAIEEWFLSGKLTSPMTNTTLPSLAYRHHTKLKRAISQFLYGDSEIGDCPSADSKETQ